MCQQITNENKLLQTDLVPKWVMLKTCQSDLTMSQDSELHASSTSSCQCDLSSIMGLFKCSFSAFTHFVWFFFCLVANVQACEHLGCQQFLALHVFAMAQIMRAGGLSHHVDILSWKQPLHTGGSHLVTTSVVWQRCFMKETLKIELFPDDMRSQHAARWHVSSCCCLSQWCTFENPNPFSSWRWWVWVSVCHCHAFFLENDNFESWIDSLLVWCLQVGSFHCSFSS